MMTPCVTEVFLASSHGGVLTMSPLTAAWPVTSIQVPPLSVVLAPRVRTQDGSLPPVVKAPSARKTRSLLTAGGANCRLSAPAETDVVAAHAVTAA
ncbi:hypothetical protein [Bradyrhizobium septentrionale]|uniref:Secreted protein n=1 Tax=Bradyrhizobium septentrionale TaxID=1404411 RepID=A0ABZ2P8K4_9BRAD